MKIKNLFVVLLVTFLPVIVSAQLGTQPFSKTKGLISSVGDIIQLLIVLAAAVALLAFFWGLAKFIFRIGGDEKAVSEGKTIMKWGLVALFVMISVWGIIGFFQRELGLPDTTGGDAQKVPKTQTSPPFDLPDEYDIS